MGPPPCWAAVGMLGIGDVPEAEVTIIFMPLHVGKPPQFCRKKGEAGSTGGCGTGWGGGGHCPKPAPKRMFPRGFVQGPGEGRGKPR